MEKLFNGILYSFGLSYYAYNLGLKNNLAFITIKKNFSWTFPWKRLHSNTSWQSRPTSMKIPVLNNKWNFTTFHGFIIPVCTLCSIFWVFMRVENVSLLSIYIRIIIHWMKHNIFGNTTKRDPTVILSLFASSISLRSTKFLSELSYWIHTHSRKNALAITKKKKNHKPIGCVAMYCYKNLVVL